MSQRPRSRHHEASDDSEPPSGAAHSGTAARPHDQAAAPLDVADTATDIAGIFAARAQTLSALLAGIAGPRVPPPAGLSADRNLTFSAAVAAARPVGSAGQATSGTTEFLETTAPLPAIDVEVPEKESQPLSTRVRRGALWTVISTLVLRLSGILLTAVIAHILAPRDFGIFAVASTAYAIVSSIGELGVTSCLIRADLDIDALAPTVATISFATNAALAAAMTVFARPIAVALGSAAAANPIRVMALAVIFVGIFAVPTAQLTRDFKQDKLFLANIIGFVPSTVVLILLARSGSGAMAFAWSRVVGQFTVGCVLAVSAGRTYRPGLRRSALSVILKFGLPLAGANLINYILLNVDYALIGHLLGAVSLGIYVLAFNVASWPASLLGAVINNVSMPAFSRVKHDAQLLNDAIPKALRAVSLVALPMCGLTIVLARPLVLTMYGGKWALSANVLSVLALYGAVSIICTLFANILAGMGRANILLTVQLIWLAALVPAMALGVHIHGIIGAGVAHVIVISPIVLPCYLLTLRRTTKVRFTGLIRAVAPALVASLIAAFAARVAAAEFSYPLLQLIAGLAAGGLVYLVLTAPLQLTFLGEAQAAKLRTYPIFRLYAAIGRLVGVRSAIDSHHAADAAAAVKPTTVGQARDPGISEALAGHRHDFRAAVHNGGTVTDPSGDGRWQQPGETSGRDVREKRMPAGQNLAPSFPLDFRLGDTGRIRRLDAVTLLTIYLVLVMGIPQALQFAPLGGVGAPNTIFAVVLFVVYMLAWFHPRSVLDRAHQPIRIAAVLWLCAILAAYVAATRHMLPQPEANGADRGVILACGLVGVLLLAADGVDSMDRLGTLLRRIVAGGTAMAILGMTQFFTGLDAANYIIIPGLTSQEPYTDLLGRGSFNRPSATAAHPLEFAAVLAICLPLAIHQARFAPPGKRKLRWAQVAVIAATMPMTVSRTAIVGLIVVGIVILPTWPKTSRRFAYLVIFGSIFVFEAVIPGLLGTIRGLFAGIATDSSAQERTGAFSLAAPLISHHPLLGQGFGTLLPEYFFFTDDQYLNSLVETGFIGLLALITLLASGWFTARRVRSVTADGELRHLAQCLAASVAAAAVSFATFDALGFQIAAGLTFLVLGCVGAFWRLAGAQVPALSDALPRLSASARRPQYVD
jgi:lipopolysaccharide exporter